MTARVNHRRLRSGAVGLVAFVGCAVPLRAQIGRFQIFAPIAGASGRCHATPIQSAIPGEAANRVVRLDLDGEPQRNLSVTTNARGGVATLVTFLSASAGGSRREGERAMARFDANGQLLRGERSYFTVATPATMSEDRSQPITKDDADAALQLAKRVLERCARS